MMIRFGHIPAEHERCGALKLARVTRTGARRRADDTSGNGAGEPMAPGPGPGAGV